MAKKQVNGNVNQSFLQTVVNEFTIEEFPRLLMKGKLI